MSDSPSTSDALFGEEELGFDPSPKRVERRLPIRPIVAVGVVLLLALLWYVSSVHHSRFYLQVSEGRVVVQRGLYLPFGTSQWAPTSAYDPFMLSHGVQPKLTGAMSHKEVDTELRTLFVAIARAELDDLREGDPTRAEDMLMRTHKLRYTTPHQDREIFEMLGDVSFHRGLNEVRSIQERFDEALKQFRLATRRGGHTTGGAQKWVDAIIRLRQEFRQLAVDSGLDPDRLFNSSGPSLPDVVKPKTEPEPPKTPASTPPTTPESDTP